MERVVYVTPPLSSFPGVGEILNAVHCLNSDLIHVGNRLISPGYGLLSNVGWDRSDQSTVFTFEIMCLDDDEAARAVILYHSAPLLGLLYPDRGLSDS